MSPTDRLSSVILRIIRFFVAVFLGYIGLFLTMLVTGSAIVGLIVMLAVFFAVMMRGME